MDRQQAFQQLRQIGQKYGVEVYRSGRTQQHFLVNDPAQLVAFCEEIAHNDYYLMLMIANDERGLEDHCFKIYLLFSHPLQNVILTIEYSLQQSRATYPSICSIFPAAAVFEQEIADMFGLFPEQDTPLGHSQTYLHNSYPAVLSPLRRDSTQLALQHMLNQIDTEPSIPPGLSRPQQAVEGEVLIPVGPIHAGVIEPGHFLFRTSGEAIEHIDLLLGYTHKGIERLFQSHFNLANGVTLASRVSGDTAFAHTLAYCKAVENLSKTRIPETVHLLRAAFLELERLVNHIQACSILAHDLALEIPASDMSVIREQLMRLCERISGSRFLNGVNQVGGVRIP
jgi:hydrogenase-4 component G